MLDCEKLRGKGTAIAALRNAGAGAGMLAHIVITGAAGFIGSHLTRPVAPNGPHGQRD